MDKKDMAAQIAAWKKKHGDVFAYEADGKTCYLHSCTESGAMSRM